MKRRSVCWVVMCVLAMWGCDPSHRFAPPPEGLEGGALESCPSGTRLEAATYDFGHVMNCLNADDRLEGPYRSWHLDGSRLSEGRWKGGLREGAWTWWEPDGTLRSQGSYDTNGLPHGPWLWERTPEGMERCLFEHGAKLKCTVGPVPPSF